MYRFNDRSKRIVSPGDLYFGKSDLLVETVLGSCVSIVLWSEKKGIGGMCHFVLPESQKKYNKTGYTGVDAITNLIKKIKLNNLKMKDFTYKIFGGSCIAQNRKLECFETDVGSKNVEFAKDFIFKNNLDITAEDTGGSYSRKLILDMKNGEVWLRKTLIERRISV